MPLTRRLMPNSLDGDVTGATICEEMLLHGGARESEEASRLFVGEPAPTGASTITYSTYDVFISHKGDDMRIAETVGDALQHSGLSGYLDRWDPAVEGDSPELEIYLRCIIRETKTILAIVTENTPLSLVGTIRDRSGKRDRFSDCHIP